MPGVEFHCEPGLKPGVTRVRMRVPGDKSISHRAAILGALANGRTEVSGFLEGEDTLATVRALRALGVRIDGPDRGALRIEGVGLQGLQPPAGPLDLGNSGTGMRLLAGVLAAQPFACELIGDASLNSRPMRRISDPLTAMGASVRTGESGTPPLEFAAPPAGLKGIRYEMPVASAQVKSCLLLAGLYAEGETCVVEPAPSRDHTERMLRGFGYAVSRQGASVSLTGGAALAATDIDVPSDISSAAFFMVAAAIAPDLELTLEHVGVNPTRTGVIDILRAMGADIELRNLAEAGGEPVADITVRSSELRGIDIEPELVPLAIDEFPAIFVAAACASGRTRLSEAEELRVKESDRIAAMANGLSQLGVGCDPRPDGILIEGRGGQGGGAVRRRPCG